MDQKSSKKGSKKSYDEISSEKRRELIRLIDQEKCTILDAAKRIGIKHCTAKHILYSYRRSGKIFEKKKKQVCCNHHNSCEHQPLVQYIYVPWPVYVICPLEEGSLPVNFGQEPYP